MLTFFTNPSARLKASAIYLDRVALTMIDGGRRRITQGVSLSITKSEILADRQTRHFALHAKRGNVSGALINWLKEYLREKGWSFQGVASAPTRGTWEGVFRK